MILDTDEILLLISSSRTLPLLMRCLRFLPCRRRRRRGGSDAGLRPAIGRRAGRFGNCGTRNKGQLRRGLTKRRFTVRANKPRIDTALFACVSMLRRIACARAAPLRLPRACSSYRLPTRPLTAVAFYAFADANHATACRSSIVGCRGPSDRRTCNVYLASRCTAPPTVAACIAALGKGVKVASSGSTVTVDCWRAVYAATPERKDFYQCFI